MNDWEIGGTQNKWVCPSDRHLHLRAQLKSGWSVRTATARSPTNSKGNNGITEAEQEHIRQVGALSFMTFLEGFLCNFKFI
ncbi:unnamed protein product [Heligmosomoides polygyrus]|uniref:Uncharacterized protein n=1 Tax=Heligmosomoides polygyrus TaxID=6339 RepID=A0A183FF89_HELPZ|nr:unnamed protein product [Heligmosomoides polygyrus]